MPDEQTPLKLVKDSYYEMQVEKNTTVKVVYQKIPASEEESDGEDDGETKKPTPTRTKFRLRQMRMKQIKLLSQPIKKQQLKAMSQTQQVVSQVLVTQTVESLH